MHAREQAGYHVSELTYVVSMQSDTHSVPSPSPRPAQGRQGWLVEADDVPLFLGLSSKGTFIGLILIKRVSGYYV